jgi:murein DD-endopeptidase MepM/ murein hydrolase activator NlpD
VPLAAPVSGATMSSNFGSRTDPFLGSLAFHAGIDFRAPTGRAVTATAAGKVVTAGRAGGYGNLVEIDHGRGITTRYAHLSRIEVKVGEQVASGEVVGRVGSTGRSTGPHLHYETRVDGTAVNPKTYLAAGRRIAAMLR